MGTATWGVSRLLGDESATGFLGCQQVVVLDGRVLQGEKGSAFLRLEADDR